MIFWRVIRTLVLSLCAVVFRVRVYHRERVPPDGAYVVAPSHRSILDIPFTAFVTRRRIRFLAKQELFSSRIGGWLFPRLGGIAVERPCRAPSLGGRARGGGAVGHLPRGDPPRGARGR